MSRGYVGRTDSLRPPLTWAGSCKSGRRRRGVNTMRSMTGFGIGEAALGEAKLVLEARSLNHRYLEMRVRLPTELADHCSWLEQRARERLTRGRYDIGGRLEAPTGTAPAFNMDRARAVYRALLELRDEMAPG